MYSNTWCNWDCAGDIKKKEIKIVLLIKKTLYYRERRLCRGRRRYDNCCLGHADTSLPTEVWVTLVESSWELDILEARHHLQWQSCPLCVAYKDLPTLDHLALWIICAPESQTDFFGTVWFRAAHHLRLLGAFIPLRNWKFCKSSVIPIL